MNYDSMYHVARGYAEACHKDQVRKVSGQPYITHPIRVSERVRTSFQRVVALLHDTIEDTDTTFNDIAEVFGFRVAQVVGILTHKNGEKYDDYITRVLSDPDAIAVKIADICDNLNDHPSENMLRKSFRALPRLYNINL
jgi:GTP diphosphokinase / guanosine-3',5'-bis(diphosphate) 3'-diphosphatase